MLFSFFHGNTQFFNNPEIIPASPTNSDNVQILSEVWFSIGAGETCPELSSYTFSSEGTNLYLDLFYDISGAWPFVGCYNLENFTIGTLEPGSYDLILGTNSILYNDTTFNFDIDTITVNVQDANGIKSNIDMEMRIFVTNPAKDYIVIETNRPFVTMEYRLTNLQGVEVKPTNIYLDKIDVSSIPSGIYFLKISIDGKNKIFKILIN